MQHPQRQDKKKNKRKTSKKHRKLIFNELKNYFLLLIMKSDKNWKTSNLKLIGRQFFLALILITN